MYFDPKCMIVAQPLSWDWHNDPIVAILYCRALQYPNILINDEEKSINKKIINIKPHNFLTDIQTKSKINLNKITDLSKQKIDETDNYQPKLEEILKIRSNLKHV